MLGEAFWSPRSLQKGLLGASWNSQRGPKRSPRGSQRTPKKPQESPKKFSRDPKSIQEAAQSFQDKFFETSARFLLDLAKSLRSPCLAHMRCVQSGVYRRSLTVSYFLALAAASDDSFSRESILHMSSRCLNELLQFIVLARGLACTLSRNPIFRAFRSLLFR